MSTVQLEICCTSSQAAQIAEKAGAARIELCESLEVGGITPSTACLTETVSALQIPVHVLIRCRAGNFVYTAHEHQLHLQQIEMALRLNIKGVVVGSLNEHGILLQQAKELRAAAKGISCYFHKAFDEIHDQSAALEQLIELGYDGILTSGGPSTALNGQQQLHRLLAQAHNKLVIMPGGGIRSNHAKALHHFLHASWYHSAANGSQGFAIFEEEIKQLKAALNASE